MDEAAAFGNLLPFAEAVLDLRDAEVGVYGHGPTASSSLGGPSSRSSSRSSVRHNDYRHNDYDAGYDTGMPLVNINQILREWLVDEGQQDRGQSAGLLTGPLDEYDDSAAFEALMEQALMRGGPQLESAQLSLDWLLQLSRRTPRDCLTDQDASRPLLQAGLNQHAPAQADTFSGVFATDSMAGEILVHGLAATEGATAHGELPISILDDAELFESVGDLLADTRSEVSSEQDVPTVVVQTPDEFSDASGWVEEAEEADEEVISVFDASDEPMSARLADLWSNTPAVPSTAGSSPRRPLSRNREVTAESALFDGSLSNMLRRLPFESSSLDESVASSMRRVLQMSTTLTGQRLTNTEIHELPKVQFESSAHEQQCSICLELYHFGEMLTRLPCSHCFHIECLKRWARRATCCPLCRKPCVKDDWTSLPS